MESLKFLKNMELSCQQSDSLNDIKGDITWKTETLTIE